MSVTKSNSKNKPEPASKAPAASDKKAYARFDARLTREQKNLFEKAAKIRGFKSLSEFVIHYTMEAASLIVEKNDQILASERDKAVFFEALLQPAKPNAALLKASKRYKIHAGSK